MHPHNSIKLLFVTNGTNSCTEYLRTRSDIVLNILDLGQGVVRTKEEFEQYILDICPELLLVYRCPFIISKKCILDSSHRSIQYSSITITQVPRLESVV